MFKSRRVKELERELIGLHDALTAECERAEEAERRWNYLRVQVTQWRDNEIAKDLPPMRRDEVAFQIRKSEIRQEAYEQVLMMFDTPVPYYFGREDEDDKEDA